MVRFRTLSDFLLLLRRVLLRVSDGPAPSLPLSESLHKIVTLITKPSLPEILKPLGPLSSVGLSAEVSPSLLKDSFYSIGVLSSKSLCREIRSLVVYDSMSSYSFYTRKEGTRVLVGT